MEIATPPPTTNTNDDHYWTCTGKLTGHRAWVTCLRCCPRRRHRHRRLQTSDAGEHVRATFDENNKNDENNRDHGEDIIASDDDDDVDDTGFYYTLVSASRDKTLLTYSNDASVLLNTNTEQDNDFGSGGGGRVGSSRNSASSSLLSGKSKRSHKSNKSKRSEQNKNNNNSSFVATTATTATRSSRGGGKGFGVGTARSSSQYSPSYSATAAPLTAKRLEGHGGFVQAAAVGSSFKGKGKDRSDAHSREKQKSHGTKIKEEGEGEGEGDEGKTNTRQTAKEHGPSPTSPPGLSSHASPNESSASPANDTSRVTSPGSFIVTASDAEDSVPSIAVATTSTSPNTTNTKGNEHDHPYRHHRYQHNDDDWVVSAGWGDGVARLWYVPDGGKDVCRCHHHHKNQNQTQKQNDNDAAVAKNTPASTSSGVLFPSLSEALHNDGDDDVKKKKTKRNDEVIVVKTTSNEQKEQQQHHGTARSGGGGGAPPDILSIDMLLNDDIDDGDENENGERCSGSRDVLPFAYVLTGATDGCIRLFAINRHPKKKQQQRHGRILHHRIDSDLHPARDYTYESKVVRVLSHPRSSDSSSSAGSSSEWHDAVSTVKFHPLLRLSALAEAIHCGREEEEKRNEANDKYKDALTLNNEKKKEKAVPSPDDTHSPSTAAPPSPSLPPFCFLSSGYDGYINVWRGGCAQGYGNGIDGARGPSAHKGSPPSSEVGGSARLFSSITLRNPSTAGLRNAQNQANHHPTTTTTHPSTPATIITTVDISPDGTLALSGGKGGIVHRPHGQSGSPPAAISVMGVTNKGSTDEITTTDNNTNSSSIGNDIVVVWDLEAHVALFSLPLLPACSVADLLGRPRCASTPTVPTPVGSSSLSASSTAFYPSFLKKKSSTTNASTTTVHISDISLCPTRYWAAVAVRELDDHSGNNTDTQKGFVGARGGVIVYDLQKCGGDHNHGNGRSEVGQQQHPGVVAVLAPQHTSTSSLSSALLGDGGSNANAVSSSGSSMYHHPDHQEETEKGCKSHSSKHARTFTPRCTTLCWSPDGNTLFTGYTDNTIRVWKVA